jgi:hypothetical protein
MPITVHHLILQYNEFHKYYWWNRDLNFYLSLEEQDPDSLAFIQQEPDYQAHQKN